jgi:hypothetical protein
MSAKQRLETAAPAKDPRVESFQRRVKIADLDRVATDDKDALRLAMARRIVMLINDWHGCPERMCRRQRGCMAPKIECSNHKPGPPPPPERVARVMAEFHRALVAAAARAEEEGEC